MNNKQKFDLGCEIIAAIKADVYKVDIEGGKKIVFNETSLRTVSFLSFSELKEAKIDFKANIVKFARTQLHNLIKQAHCVAEVAINNVNCQIPKLYDTISWDFTDELFKDSKFYGKTFTATVDAFCPSTGDAMVCAPYGQDQIPLDKATVVKQSKTV